MARKINMIIVHCAATKPSMDIGASEIRTWHVRDNGWRDIGYHYVIRRSGSVESGRPVEIAGAHTSGKNSNSIGVCLVGGVSDSNVPEANFTDEQWTALVNLLINLKHEYPEATIHGHNEFANKACPSFDVQKWLKEVDL